MPDLSFETQHPAPVCGVDEAGRGPWAGPVVAAAVVLDMADIPAGLDDSKKLGAARRAALCIQIKARARWGVGVASVEEIDALNILRANDLAMRRAVAGLGAAFALVDGNRIPPDFPLPARAIVKGDALSLSIAAASIIAKETRDDIMRALAQAYPGYGWETNAGYGVAAHRAALQTLGVTPHHRRSFRPIHKMLCEENNITP